MRQVATAFNGVGVVFTLWVWSIPSQYKPASYLELVAGGTLYLSGINFSGSKFAYSKADIHSYKTGTVVCHPIYTALPYKRSCTKHPRSADSYLKLLILTALCAAVENACLVLPTVPGHVLHSS